MYIRDVHIAIYLAVAILGIFVGIFVNWAIKRMSKEKPVLSKEFFSKFKMNSKSNYLIIALIMLIYISLVYVYGIKETIIANLDLIKYFILAPSLIIIFAIDYKLQIIPNRLNLTLLEIGMIFAFLYGLSNIAISINMMLGMLAGAGIFALITLIGGIVYGKEAMGLGDVKLMGVLGLFFGLSNVIAITLMAFLIGAIISILLLAIKAKKSDQYIPFGPFIVIATYISMYVPFDLIKYALMKIFTLGLYN